MYHLAGIASRRDVAQKHRPWRPVSYKTFGAPVEVPIAATWELSCFYSGCPCMHPSSLVRLARGAMSAGLHVGV